MTLRLTQLQVWASPRSRSRLALILAGALLAPLPAAAQQSCTSQPGGGMCQAPGPAEGASEPKVFAGAGNPINVMTGNKYQREVDMPALPGELGLEIVRYYNSAYSGANAVNGLVGRGWRLSYETELHAVGNAIQIAQADGVRLIFNRDPRNPSLCSTTNPANGTVSIERKRDGDAYVWRVADGRKLYFNRDGKLVQIMAPSGAFVSLQYDARGLLVKVTDPQWRSLHFSYPAKAAARPGERFGGVQAIESPVGRFAYEYGSVLPQGAAAEAKAALANLVRVRVPTSMPAGPTPAAAAAGAVTASTRSRTYHYEDARFPTLLTGISVESGTPVKTMRYATYGYDGNGRAVLSTHAGNVGKVTLDTSVGGTTVLANSLGQKTVYRHALIAGEHRLLEVRGPGCSACGETNVRYGYDQQGRLVEHTRLGATGDPIATTRAQLDGHGRVLKIFRFGYSNGRALAPIEVERNIYENENSQPVFSARPSVVPGKELTQRLTFNARGQVLSITEHGWSPGPEAPGASAPITRTLTYTYALINNRSVPVRIDGPLPNGKANSPADSDITDIEYDASGGRIVKIVEPGNVVTEFTNEDQALRPTRQRRSDGARLVQSDAELAPDGQVLGLVETGWRLQGRRVTERGRATRSERYAYDALGALAAYRSSGNVITRYRHDDAEHVSHVIASDNSQVVTGYDTEGRKIEEAAYDFSDGRSQLVAYRSHMDQLRWFDRAQPLPSNLPDTMGGAGSARMGRPHAGLHLVDTLAWTEQQRVAETAAKTGKYRAGRTGSIAEDLVEQVIRSDGSEVRRWFDDFARVVAIRSPEAGLRTAEYTAADSVRRLRNARGITTHVNSDAAGKVLNVEHIASGGRASTRIEFRYEGMVLTEAQRWENGKLDNKTLFSADVWGTVTGKTVQVFGSVPSSLPISMSVNNTYDAGGRVLKQILPSGAELQYRYDGSGRIAGIVLGDKTIVGDIRLRPTTEGKPVQFQYGNGLRAQTERDWDGTLRSHASGVDTARYETDSRGNVVGVDRLPITKLPPKHSITSAKAPSAGHAGLATASSTVTNIEKTQRAAGDNAGDRTEYGFDKAGRLISEIVAGQNRLNLGYSEIGDPLPGEGERVDTVGAVVSHGARTLTYGPGGELAGVRSGSNTLIAEYRYDAEGVRVAKHTHDGGEFYLYEDGRLIAVADSSGRVVSEYVYLGQRPIARLRHLAAGLRWGGELLRHRPEPSVEYLHTDQRNAVEAVTDESGALLWKARLSAFGELRSVQGRADFMPLRLSGQYADTETGLYYNVHRYYDPERGRYLQPDPIGIAGGLNTYAYTDGSPLLNVDPLGLKIDDDDTIIRTGPRDFRPWLFGTAVHSAFAMQVNFNAAKFPEPGWGANKEREKTWGRKRPDAYFVDDPNLKNEQERRPFAGRLWELKPVTWTKAVKPAKYKTGTNEVGDYIRAAQKGCWTAGSSSYLMQRLITDRILFEGKWYFINYMPDAANDASGLIFYQKSEQKKKPAPAKVPVPAMSKEEREQLERDMQQVGESASQQEGWSPIVVIGFKIVIGIAIALALFYLGGAIAALLMEISLVLAAGIAVVAGLAAIFGLTATETSAAELEKKGEDGKSGILDDVIGWFKKWL